MEFGRLLALVVALAVGNCSSSVASSGVVAAHELTGSGFASEAASFSYDAPTAATTPTTQQCAAALIGRASLRTAPWSSTPSSGFGSAAKAPRLLGPGTSFGTHIEDDLARRGWTKRLVQSTIDDPASTVATRDVRHIPGGGRMDDPATGYISRRGGYVVRNDRTGDIVQISNRTKPDWKAPWDR